MVPSLKTKQDHATPTQSSSSWFDTTKYFFSPDASSPRIRAHAAWWLWHMDRFCKADLLGFLRTCKNFWLGNLLPVTLAASWAKTFARPHEAKYARLLIDTNGAGKGQQSSALQAFTVVFIARLELVFHPASPFCRETLSGNMRSELCKLLESVCVSCFLGGWASTPSYCHWSQWENQKTVFFNTWFLVTVLCHACPWI